MSKNELEFLVTWQNNQTNRSMHSWRSSTLAPSCYGSTAGWGPSEELLSLLLLKRNLSFLQRTRSIYIHREPILLKLWFLKIRACYESNSYLNSIFTNGKRPLQNSKSLIFFRLHLTCLSFKNKITNNSK